MKKLYRLKYDSKLCGVCGGLGKYLNLDSTLIRILWVVVSLLTGGFTGFIAYIICAVIIPLEPDDGLDVAPKV